MTPHEAVRDLLALSASGVLDAADERSVREHVRDCAECAARLEQLAMLAGDLAALPVPAIPPDLALRTQALMAAELAARAERRQGAVLAALAGGFGWGLALLTAYFFQLAAGGSMWMWLAGHSAVALLGAAAAAALYQQQRNSERSAL